MCRYFFQPEKVKLHMLTQVYILIQYQTITHFVLANCPHVLAVTHAWLHYEYCHLLLPFCTGGLNLGNNVDGTAQSSAIYLYLIINTTLG